MMMKKLFSALLCTAALTAGGTAQAAAVTCGDSTLGVRAVVVAPGLEGGYCVAQEGNLRNSDISALGLTLLAKEVALDGDIASALLDFTMDSARTSGEWRIAASSWGSWNQLYLGLHFGNGTTATDSSPDSFVIELARPSLNGSWALTGPMGFNATGLSNVYLLAKGPCTTCEVPVPFNSVPEPGTLALLAAAALATGIARRRKA